MSPRHGVVTPDEFIPIAEEAGLMADLGRFVIERAVCDSLRWPQLNPAINVSAAQVSLAVSKHLTHEPTCGAMQWFHPFASMDESAMGVANQHLFTGYALGTKWSDPNKRSAFFGTFSY